MDYVALCRTGCGTAVEDYGLRYKSDPFGCTGGDQSRPNSMLAPTFWIVLAATAQAVNAATNITVYSNDTTTLQYTGFDWKPYTGCSGTMFTYSRGHFFSFSFVGTGVYYYGTRSAKGGISTADLDGEQTSIDRWANETYQCGNLLYGRGGLTNTRHTVTFTLTGNSPNATENGYIDWQWLQYTQLDASDSTSSAPSSSSSISAPTQSGGSGSSAGKVGGIIGGVLGGLAVLVLAAFLLWRKHKKNTETITSFPHRTDLNFGEPHPPPFEGRTSGVPQAWAPHAMLASNLAPSTAPTVSGYSPTGYQASPFTADQRQQHQPLLQDQQYHPYPHQAPPPLMPAQTGSVYSGPTDTISPTDSRGRRMSESEVAFIASRVASMIGPVSQPQYGTPSSSGPSDQYDAPPPMYYQGQAAPVNPVHKGPR